MVVQTRNKGDQKVLNNEAIVSKYNTNEKIIVKNKNKQMIIAVEDILFIERNQRNTYIHIGQDSYKIEKSLKHLVKELPDYFIRVHKSYLVNKNKISTIICIGDRTYNIEFKTSNKVARMSRNKYKEIKDILI